MNCLLSKKIKLSPRRKQLRLAAMSGNSPKDEVTKKSPQKRQLRVQRISMTPTKYKKFPFSSPSCARRSLVNKGKTVKGS